MPSGKNGARLPDWKPAKATMQKKIKMPILAQTMTALTVALFAAPRSKRNIANRTTTTAGMLITPPCPAGDVIELGRFTPIDCCRKLSMYWPQPTATADTETAYSSMRHQPHTQATSSPIVA